jgi:pyruvate formate lyase activating enzyme
MKIRGFTDTSFVDWDGKISSVVFTEGCNLRCTFCYNFGLVLHPQNFDLVEEEHILGYLRENSDFLDGVCISGGEPTLQEDLLQFCRKIKGLGLGIKLDTNGMNPKLLKQLIDEGLIDYIAMDVKAPLNAKEYSEVAGVSLNGSMDEIKHSIQIVIDSGLDHEFRTTVVPDVHTVESVEAISKSLVGARRFRLQKFQPHTRFEHLNVKKPQSDEEMEELAEAARRHVKEVDWRGR